MNQTFPVALGFTAIVAACILFWASSAAPNLLSPQGCRMSYMSPSYILQTAFDSSWTPLATRYSLWLYREVEWDSHHATGTPVLFIPGNAGSSHQVRSIASSAARQYFYSPGLISPEFAARSIKPLDVYAVEFNEDLSAFHGPTLLAQRTYVLDAIRYISTLYPQDTRVIVLGHSMGGVVAISLLPSPNISTIITMSTPHTLPPARFDRRIEEIFRDNSARLRNDLTPIVSLCGGATDLMVPSESCVLPIPVSAGIYRNTLFTSALEGSWTGVGHREMVWCHQVRWQVARTALELSGAPTVQERMYVLDKWLRDGRYLPTNFPRVSDAFSKSDILAKTVPPNEHLSIASPKFKGSRLFYMPYNQPRKFVLYVSQGTIRSVSPHHPIALHVEIFNCEGAGPPFFSSNNCVILDPYALRLLPNSHVDHDFPIPQAGADETEGIVLFEADLSSTGKESWITVKVDGADDGRGWLAGGFLETNHSLQADISTSNAMFSRAIVPLLDSNAVKPNVPLKMDIHFPHLLTSVLIVYRLTPHFPEGHCTNNLLSPLLVHSTFTESHYHRLLPPSAAYSRPVLLHTHSSAPFVSNISRRGIDLVIYTSGEQDGCFPDQLELRVDWWTTMGMWAHRYWPATAAWSIGIVSLLIWQALGSMESEQGAMPSVTQSLSNYGKIILPRLLLGSFLLSFLPLPSSIWLGNAGEAVFAPLAPLILIFCSGLVILSWWILETSMFISRYFITAFDRLGLSRSRDSIMKPRKLRITIASIAFVFILIFLFIPWQVAFLGGWIIHYSTCVASSQRLRSVDTSPPPSSSSTWSKPAAKDYTLNNHNASTHFLLLMTWLLPLAAPILGVWVRTLATAGWTTPFDGDHNFLYVAPFLLFADWSWTCVRKHGRIKLLQKTRIEKISTKWSIAMIALVAFLYGPRFNYFIFEFASAGTGLIFAFRVGARYWRAG